LIGIPKLKQKLPENVRVVYLDDEKEEEEVKSIPEMI